MLRRRTPLRRGGPLRRRSRLAKVSAKQAKLIEQRREFERQFLAARPICEVCGQELAVEVHERLTRARGGSILDAANCVAVGRACHRRIHDNPEWATAQGLLVSQYLSDGGVPTRSSIQ